MMRVERLTSALVGSFFPWSEVEQHLRIISDEVAEALRLLDAAGAELEKYAGLALIDQTVRVSLDGWTDFEWFPLPVAPLRPGAAIAVTINGAAAMPTSVAYGLRPAIRFTDAAAVAAIEIFYTAGFGAGINDVPPDIRAALLDQTLAWFDGRGSTDRKIYGMSAHMARVAARYRRVGL